MSPYPGPVRRILAAAALTAGIVGSAAFPQSLCTIPNYLHAWVDPVKGNDATAVVGNRALPYRTIGGASAAVAAGVCGTPTLGLVHCLPGIYSPPTNGEAFPISMRDGVHLRGAGAKECVIRGAGNPNIPVFLPVAPIGGYALQEVLVDFSTIQSTTSESASLDGFTFLGGDVQVLFTSAHGDSQGRVSNCLFDLRDPAAPGVPGPSFGILMVNPYLSKPGPGYHECRASVFQCTFIQGYRPAAGPIQTAKPCNVAICDVTDNTGDPNVASGNPPYAPLRGVSRPSVQNCLVRSLPEAPRTAFLGLDELDTNYIIIPGFPLAVPSNSFDYVLNGMTTFDPTYTYCSVYSGLPPKPNVDLHAIDPSFVGEMIGDLNLQAGIQSPEVRDFRLLFDSPLVNRGRITPMTVGACKATLMNGANGNCYSEANDPAYLHGSFQNDGEGYGNERVAFSWIVPALMPIPDVGFDETDTFIIAGCYANESKSHGNPWDPTIATGNTYRWYLTPGTTDAVPGLYLIGSLVPFPQGEAWSEYPGTGPIQTFTSIVGEYALAKNAAYELGYFPLTPITWINPIDGSTHSVRYSLMPYDDSNVLPAYLTEQIGMYRYGTLYVSNLQAEHL